MMMSGDHPNNSIIEIGQNTKKNPGDLKRLSTSGKPSANTGVKNSQTSNIKIKENEKIDKYLEHAGELKKKAVEHEGENDTNCVCCAWKIKRTENQRKIGIVGISLNTQKCPGDLRRLAVIQIPMKKPPVITDKTKIRT